MEAKALKKIPAKGELPRRERGTWVMTHAAPPFCFIAQRLVTCSHSEFRKITRMKNLDICSISRADWSNQGRNMWRNVIQSKSNSNRSGSIVHPSYNIAYRIEQFNRIHSTERSTERARQQHVKAQGSDNRNVELNAVNIIRAEVTAECACVIDTRRRQRMTQPIHLQMYYVLCIM